MAQRHICPSMGALRRSLLLDASASLNCTAKAFHSSARRLEEPASSTTSDAPAPNTRKARSATALRQIANLGQRRVAPSGQMVRRIPSQGKATEQSASSSRDARDGQREASPRSAKLAAGPKTTRGAATPPGQMVRAPAKLRITQRVSNNATVGGMRGPNLRGRDGKGPSAGREGRNKERGPKKREKGSGGGDMMQRTGFNDVDASTTLSDGMVHHLLRLQRKEWDRKPYEPKYAKGSFAANELIHAGRELCKGETPPVKIWGPLEKRIGVVGMFGAEAHLKVRRVPDGDAEPFGQEVLELGGADEARDIANKADAARQPPQV